MKRYLEDHSEQKKKLNRGVIKATGRVTGKYVIKSAAKLIKRIRKATARFRENSFYFFTNSIITSHVSPTPPPHHSSARV